MSVAVNLAAILALDETEGLPGFGWTSHCSFGRQDAPEVSLQFCLADNSAASADFLNFFVLAASEFNLSLALQPKSEAHSQLHRQVPSLEEEKTSQGILA